MAAMSASAVAPQGGPHAGVAGGEAVVVDDRHAQPAESVLSMPLLERHRRGRQRGRVALVGAGGHVEEAGGVAHASGPAGRSGSCRRGRARPVPGGSVRGCPSRRRRPTSRPGKRMEPPMSEPVARGTRPGGERGTRAAARTARGALEVPRVAGRTVEHRGRVEEVADLGRGGEADRYGSRRRAAGSTSCWWWCRRGRGGRCWPGCRASPRPARAP